MVEPKSLRDRVVKILHTTTKAVRVVMVSYIRKLSALLPDEILQLLAKSMYKDACRDKYFEDGVMPILPKSKRSESQQVCIVVSTDTSPSEWCFMA